MRRRELISLFCGPGGFDAGFEAAGFLTRLAYDNDPASVRTHQRNHPISTTMLADISALKAQAVVKQWRTLSRSAPVGVIGGSPCQSFSTSNVHQDPDDPRHALPNHFARLLEGLVQEFDLDFFVFENVPGLTYKKHERVLQRLQSRLRKAGFNLFSSTLDAQNFGVAQRRARLFVVGINRTRYPNLHFEFPHGSPRRRTVADLIRDLPEPVHYSERRDGKAKIPYHPNHWCMSPRAKRFTDGSISTNSMKVGRSFRILDWNKPSYTVAYGNREVHVHPNGHRRLSIFEAMRLQGFPKRYVLKGNLSDQIRLVSDAVPPPVARAIAKAIARQLGIGMNSRKAERGKRRIKKLPRAKTVS